VDHLEADNSTLVKERAIVLSSVTGKLWTINGCSRQLGGID
jgi:hypothetical protein